MKKLIFVYNGDSGLANGVLHYLHKRISPDTYSCDLCGMVYDGMSLKKDWLDFVKSLGVPTEFLHRDEYQKAYGKSSLAWPAVLLHDDQKLLKVVLKPADFKQIESLDVLQQKIRTFVDSELPAGSAA